MTTDAISARARARLPVPRAKCRRWPLMCLVLGACTGWAAEPNNVDGTQDSSMTETSDKPVTRNSASDIMKEKRHDDASSVPAASAGKINDVTFSTAYDSSSTPKSADFYYNGRAIGSGREAFTEIIERIGKLPDETSVVWGPNYDRDGTGSGSDYGCVPKFLYPDLWKDLESVTMQRGPILSSAYPGPWPTRIPGDNRGAMPAPLDVDDAAADGERFDAVLDWQIKPYMRKPKERIDFFAFGAHRNVFLSAGEPLSRFGLDLFFGRLPVGSHVLVRVSCADGLDPSTCAVAIRSGWERWLDDPLRLGNTTATLAAHAKVAAEVCLLIKRSTLQLDWTNFHGPETEHDEALYRINGRYVGRGDEGFDRILATVQLLAEGAKVELPQYELGGPRVWHSGLPEKEIQAKNDALQKVVPFATRRAEFEALIADRKLSQSFSFVRLDLDPRTVVDWNSGDRFGKAFVSFGKIIRSADKRRKAPVSTLSWAHYEQGGQIPGKGIKRRQLENQAIYTLDGVDVGRGVAGFANAMRKLANLPADSVVQVRVCLRTTPPFRCPITYQGRRHFERTGFEPYAGMFPWLIDFARKHKLQIEWIPDELNSCEDCQLNK